MRNTRSGPAVKIEHAGRGRWFRFYERELDDPCLQRLSAELFRTHVNLLCLCSISNGVLPAIEAVAFRLRMSSSDARRHVDDLICAGLVDILPDGRLTSSGWSDRQYRSDRDRSAVRMKKMRARRKGVTDEVTTSDASRDARVTPLEEEEEEDSILAGRNESLEGSLNSRGESRVTGGEVESLGDDEVVL